MYSLILHFHPKKVNEASIRFNRTFGLGGMAALLIFIQIITGILLRFYYDPYPAEAYNSVLFLKNQVLFGQFIRNIHYWSGVFLLIIVFLHLLWVFLTGAYRDTQDKLAVRIVSTGFGRTVEFYWLPVALDEYKKSLEYVADFHIGRYNLGNYYSKLKDYVQAEVNFREAITADNLFSPAKTNLAMIYYNEGKLDLATDLFRDLVKNHPEVSDGYYYLALFYGWQKSIRRRSHCSKPLLPKAPVIPEYCTILVYYTR